MRAWLIALALAAAGPAIALPPSGTLLFEAAAVAHWEESPECWKGLARRRPPERQRRALIRGILAGCDRWYAGDDMAPYRFMALLMTETNGVGVQIEKPREKTYGPWCATVGEVREVCRLYRLPCPRSTWEIRDRLLADPEWSCLVAIATVRMYEREQGYDQVRGFLMYKAGATGMRRIRAALADDGRPLTASDNWRHFMDNLAWLCCLRDRILAGGAYVRCGCLPPEVRAGE